MNSKAKAAPPTLYYLYAAKSLRTFGFGLSSVIFAVFLSHCGLSTIQIGLVLSATLITDALATMLVSSFAEKIGRKKVLVISSFLIVISGLVLAFSRTPWHIVLASIFGIISPQGYEGGPFGAIEQALVSECSESEELSRTFSIYNLLGFAGAALGSLLAGSSLFAGYTGFCSSPAFLSQHFPVHLDKFSASFCTYAFIGVILLFLYARMDLSTENSSLTNELSYGRESNDDDGKETPSKTNERALVWKRIWGLSFLQGLDAFGGGMIPQTLIALWFLDRFKTGPEFSGPVFFWTNVLAAASFFFAPYICKRFGLLNTMVFTHLPCSLSLCLLPFLPSAAGAGALLISRSLLSSMDIPARQAYLMALVEEKDRSTAAGISMSSRSLGQCAAPVFAGLALAGAYAGMPFILAGACKTTYDICLFLLFRKVPLYLKSGS